MKRVAVTGLGILSPLGNDLESCWTAAINGVSGISKITSLDMSKQAVQIGGEVKKPAAISGSCNWPWQPAAWH